MVSTRIIDFLKSKYWDDYNYEVRLQDFTDEQFTKIYQSIKPKDWWDIEDYLYEHAENEEVQAHLKGFDSAEERRQMVARTKYLQSLI